MPDVRAPSVPAIDDVSPLQPLAASDRTLSRADKRVTRGTHRSLSIERSLLNAQRVAERVGISRVANVTGLDHVGLPVVAVYRPNARSIAVSQGKGLDLNAATVSGMMEAIESYCAEHVELPLRLTSARELKKRAKVVELPALPRRSHRDDDQDRSLLFCEALELDGGDTVFVPYELVHTNFSLPLPTGSGAFLMSSNGLASGNHKLEAISHGLCELIERDAMALFRAEGGVARHDRRIDPSRIADADCRRVIALIEAAELACGIWEVTSDVGIAAFACVIVDRRENLFRQLYFATGSGCHPNR
ncbi:MAG TPA: YcaO-like family protein, partial [Polyangiales bacterium]